MIKAFSRGPFTGRHMTAILVLFFAVVLVVNLIMARVATGTFGGVVVENSYVASQQFNAWLAEARRERALGWQAAASREADGRVALHLAGLSAGPVQITGEARHPLGRRPDQTVEFDPAGPGRYLSRAALPPGRWSLRIIVRQGGQVWRSEAPLP